LAPPCGESETGRTQHSLNARGVPRFRILGDATNLAVKPDRHCRREDHKRPEFPNHKLVSVAADPSLRTLPRSLDRQHNAKTRTGVGGGDPCLRSLGTYPQTAKLTPPLLGPIGDCRQLASALTPRLRIREGFLSFSRHRAGPSTPCVGTVSPTQRWHQA